jgi:hypothetical protein
MSRPTLIDKPKHETYGGKAYYAIVEARDRGLTDSEARLVTKDEIWPDGHLVRNCLLRYEKKGLLRREKKHSVYHWFAVL